MLKLCVDLFRELEGREEELFSCMIKYLVMFENDSGVVVEVVDIVKEIVCIFISLLMMFYGDFLVFKGM